MNVTVEYKDKKGTVSTQTHPLTRLAFAKHLGIAGQRYAPSPKKLIRTIAMFLHYWDYIQRQEFNENKFSLPPIQLSDPTEKGQFSNLAGKAIADFLSKRIDHSLYTDNYEAAMRLYFNGKPIKGPRPDLLAFKEKGQTFAIEAKGFTQGFGDMTVHKKQSQTGGIPVNFTVACVSYDLYKKIQCKYHDPFNENVPFDKELLSGLSKKYYQGLSGFLNKEYFKSNTVTVQGEEFYEVEIYPIFKKLFLNELPFRPIWDFEIRRFYNPILILPKKINEYAENGLTSDTKPFLFETNGQDENIYIDNDRVGVGLRLGR